MTFLDRIDVLVLTWNEEANLARTLDALARFPRVVVLDSGSTDATLAIAARYANVRVCHHAFESHAAQWNHGLAQCALAAEWVLALDADHVLTPALVDEIAALDPAPATTGFRLRYRYCVLGRPLRGSLYPPTTALYRREGARYLQDGHTQRLIERDGVQSLAQEAFHDDRKPLAAWLAAQDRYARLECALLRATPWAQLGWRDRVRSLTFIAPWLVPLYCLIAKGGIADGRHGFYYALQRGIAEALLSLRLIESHLQGTREC